jgi:HEAT repeat protein
MAVERLLECDPAAQVRLAAIEALGRLAPPDAVTILESLTRSHERDIAAAALRALGHLSSDDANTILLTLVRADDAWRRVEAVTALGAKGGVEAVSALQWVAAADGDPDVVQAAIDALVLLASHETDGAFAATTALISLTGERAHREAVVAGLAALPRRRTNDIAKGLEHPSLDVRRAIIEALGRMKNPEASTWLEHALEDQASAVRATAVVELRRLGSRRAARKLLTLARTDPDPDVRHAAVLAVTRHADDVSVDTQREAR